MEKSIDERLLNLEPTIMLENMDITEKIMYLDYLMESDSIKKIELENAVSLEQILQKEGILIEILC